LNKKELAEYTTYNEIENVVPEFLSMIKLPEENGKKLNYLIVCPIASPDGIDKLTAYGFPLGMAMVSSALKASGRNVYNLNFNYKAEPLRYLKHAILNKNIDVVLTGGFSVLFWNIKMILDASKEIKPDIITIAGGGIITADPVIAMEALENADYGVIGEGEITVNALAYALECGNDPANLEGIILHRKGKWLVSDNPSPIPNLDILPFPDYEGLEYAQVMGKPGGFEDLLKTKYSLGIAISRSCTFNCTFCFHTCGNNLRQMSMDTIFKLLDWVLSLYPIDSIRLEEEMTFSTPSFAIEFCRRIKPYNLKWICLTRVDMATQEVLSAMKEGGCAGVMIGIESADDRILKSMRKGTTIEQVENAYIIANEIGLDARGFLIFGDLEESTETFWNSINWWLKYRNRFHIRRLLLIRAYPGTHLYKVACKRGIIKDRIQFLKDGFPPVNLSKMTDDEYNMMLTYIAMLDKSNKLENMNLEIHSDYTVGITGRCPHCSEEIQYKRLKYVVDINLKSCPACGCGVIINPIESFDFVKLEMNVKSFLQESVNVAIWAINAHNSYWLLKATKVFMGDNIKLINKNEVVVPENGCVVRTLEGKKVFTPDVISLENIDTVVVPNNSKVFKQIRKECKEKYPSVKRVVHITELLSTV